jgi:hypothetical protein
MTKDAFTRSVVVAALALLWAGPGMAQTPGSPAPVAAQLRFPATSFLTPTKATWESTRTLVLGIADSVPEDKYDFKPTPAVRTFREILIHLIGENYTFFSRVSGDNLGSNARFDTLKSRAEIMKALRESYDYGTRVWEGLTEEKAWKWWRGGAASKSSAGRPFSE